MLNDATRLKDVDHIGVADGGKAVRDHEGRAVLHQGIHAALDVPLGTGIDRACGLVKHQDGGA